MKNAVLNAELRKLDRELLQRVAERQRVAAELADSLRETGHAARNYALEKELLENAREAAAANGLPADLGEALVQQLIRASLTAEERSRVVAAGHGSGKTALVIGGRGKMGGWFVEFLASQGFAVEVADPAGPLSGYDHLDDWRSSPLDQDVIVVATPLRIAAEALVEIARRQPPGLVLDIGSLKTPLRASLGKAAEAGCRIASVHPMFGPDTRLLSGRHVIFVDTGVPAATAEARRLFASTMAEQVEMSLDEHDRMIAYVLGLSHALSIAFVSALTESHETAAKLAQLSSTTFDAQLAVSGRVAAENPALYFEIQAMNEHGRLPLRALLRAVQRLLQLIEESDQNGFADMMRAGHRYLSASMHQRAG